MPGAVNVKIKWSRGGGGGGGSAPIVTVWSRSSGTSVNNPNPLNTAPTEVGQILQVYPYRWDNNWTTRKGVTHRGAFQSPSGVSSSTLTLAAGTTGVTVGRYLLIEEGLSKGLYGRIATWNESTKVVTLGGLSGSSGVKNSLAVDSSSRYAVCDKDAELAAQSVLTQKWQRRNDSGSAWADIEILQSGTLANGNSYTTQTVDAGKQISVLETLSDSSGVSSKRSSIYTIAAKAINPALVQASNLQYVGAFRAPEGGNDYRFSKYGLYGLSFDPDGDGGNGSLYASSFNNTPQGSGNINRATAEFTIPATIVNSTTISALTSATFIQSPTDALESQFTDLAMPTPAGGDYTYLYGSLVYNGKLILAANSRYQKYTSVSHFRRPKTLATTGQIEQGWARGNWWDGTAYSPEPRPTSGPMCHIPSGWQAALGGKVLTASRNMSLVGTLSAGPGAWVIEPDDLAGKTFITGTCPSQAGLGQNQIKLAPGTTGITTNMAVGLISGAGSFPSGAPADNQSRKIIAWDNATKIATLNLPWEAGRQPDTTTVYKIWDSIAATQLLYYNPPETQSLESSDELSYINANFDYHPSVWGAGFNGSTIPFGTDTLMCFGSALNNFIRYSNDWPIYNPYSSLQNGGSGGPFGYPDTHRIWMYDLNTLASVKAGFINSWDALPYATWSFDFWPSVNARDASVNGVAYDNIRKRLYVAVANLGASGESIILVYNVTNAV